MISFSNISSGYKIIIIEAASIIIKVATIMYYFLIYMMIVLLVLIVWLTSLLLKHSDTHSQLQPILDRFVLVYTKATCVEASVCSLHARSYCSSNRYNDCVSWLVIVRMCVNVYLECVLIETYTVSFLHLSSSI
jgi:hypothetical protein